MGDEPATIERKSYAERLAAGLARAGHEVVVARARRGVFPRRSGTKRGEPTVVELSEGPVPQAATGPNRLLGRAAALHAGFARLAAERGPFDAIVGEGALGGLVAQPLAERLGKPFFLALDDCEVTRHGNRLTRAQVNVAELEHWSVERAASVVVPRREVADSVGSFYRGERTRVVEPPTARVLVPREAESFMSRLGLRGDFTLVFSPHEGEKEKDLLLKGAVRQPLVLVTDDVRVRLSEGGTLLLARAAARGAVLGALVAAARRIVTLDPSDPRAAEARDLGYPVATVSAGEALAKGAERLESAKAEARTFTRHEDLAPLVALVAEQLKTVAAGKEAPLALLH